MRSLAIGAMALLLALGEASPSLACSRKFEDDLLFLDAGWRERFRTAFSSVGGVYLVRVAAAGALADDYGRMACDERSIPPPPPPPGRAALRAYEAELRRAKAADEACSPELAQVTVIETLKGARRSGWLETASFIDVVSGPPVEPVRVGAAPAYGYSVYSRPGFCTAWVARRMSASAQYLVFVQIDQNPNVHPRLVITNALLADGSTPFLAEARKLSPKR